MLIAHLSGSAAEVAAVAGIVMIADFVFTATAVIAQPITGLALACTVGYPLSEGWIVLSIILYMVTGPFWLPVVWMLMKLRTLPQASALAGKPLPARYHRLFWLWFALGSVLAIFWLMPGLAFGSCIATLPKMGDIQLRDEVPWPGRWAMAGTAALSLLVFAGLLTSVPPLAAALGGYLAFTMALITLIDLRHFIIPDALSLPAIPIGLAASALLQPEGDWGAGLASGLSGALIGCGCFFLLRTAYFKYRQVEGLGLGDVKLAAVAGAWLGPAALAPACLAATLSAIGAVILLALIRGTAPDARLHVPFGSFIAPVILVFWIANTLVIAPLW